MASNSFGTLFRITTWGESHGKAIGVVIDGCPAGIPLSLEDIQQDLLRRQPGQSPYTSPRAEKDRAEILSGLFEGITTGTPISILIWNQDADSSKYEPIKDLLRPGHANFTYLEKYGIFDYRGGGRSSARETACRVAAGAVAKKLLAHIGIEVIAYTSEIGGISAKDPDYDALSSYKEAIQNSPIFCPDPEAAQKMMQLIYEEKEKGDSVGGIIACYALHLPPGLGDPIYEKLEANLAKAILSIPATKGIEFGSGFYSAGMRGSQHNDAFINNEGKITTETNFSGGILGGISTGMPVFFKTAFKPTASIQKLQKTVDLQGKEQDFILPEGSRHDPCVTVRAVPIVEAMAALVLADAMLMHRSAKI